MRILVTGATGFAGAHLLDVLRERAEAADVFGTSHPSARVNPVFRGDRITMMVCDISDKAAVERCVKESEPDVVYHNAAFVSVARSFDDPARTFDTNVTGTVHLLEAVRRHRPDAKVLIPGSAESYGRVDQRDMPIKESQPLRARNPYGLSKVSQEMLGAYYHEVFGLKVYLPRAFHYTGPGQPTGFVCSDFARQVAMVEAGQAEPVISVGNLAARRDFSDIRDVVSAYWHIVEEGRPGTTYNVCRGESVAISGILDLLVGMSTKEISVQVDPAKLRPADVPDFVGDGSRLRTETKWSPRFALEESLKDVLAFWRAGIR